MAGTIPKRSTSSIMGSVMNQPLYQQAVLNAQNVGQDKRAVGARNNVLESLVTKERGRLLGMDQAGLELASRRDKLAFNKKIFAKKHAMAQDRLKMERRSNKLAYALGGISTIASGANVFSGYRNRKLSRLRHEELLDARNPNRAPARRFNKQYFKNYDPGYK